MNYVVLAFFLMVLLWVITKLVINKIGKEANELYEPFRKQNNELFLGDVDFSDGKYTLYVKHKEFGEFAVINENSLEENKDLLKIKGSWANYLPGEGDRSFGVMLFKDNRLLKKKNGGLFKVFEIGNLKQNSVLVKKHRFYGVKRYIQNKLDSLNKNKNAYINFQSELSKENKEFHFRVYFPSIAVPVTREKDSTGYERIKSINGIDYSEWYNGNDKGFNAMWVAQIEKCIRNKAETITDFDLSISNETLEGAYIFDVNKEWGGELRNSDNQILYLKDFMYFQYDAFIGATKENAEKLLAIDYSKCISEYERKRPGVITKMKQLTLQSTDPQLNVDKGEVGLYGFKDTITKSKTLYEQEYQLNWLEIENTPAGKKVLE